MYKVQFFYQAVTVTRDMLSESLQMSLFLRGTTSKGLWTNLYGSYPQGFLLYLPV